MKHAARMTILALSMALIAAILAVPTTSTATQGGSVTVEWLGWNGWRFTSPTGKVVLANPRITRNADAPLSVDDIQQASLILVTNGHGDEVGNSVEIAQRTGAVVVPGAFELGQWFINMGVPREQVRTTSPGSRAVVDGITVRVVHSIHGVGVNPVENIYTSGIAGAFFVTFENGSTLYYGGSGSATQDMAMWAAAYQPDAAVIHMGGDKEPMDYAMAVRLLMTDNPNLTALFPGHHLFVPRPGQTTVADVQAAIDSFGLGLTVTEPAPGVPYTFTK